VLEAAQARGFLGPGPVIAHIERSLDLASAFERDTGHYLDLGSGGGVPGLPLAMLLPQASWTLLEGSTTRSDFLRNAVTRLRLGGRVDVVSQRAEDAGRGTMRAKIDGVVARSFAPPAVTAECAAPFLRVGGILVVTEPPGEPVAARWDTDGLASLGLRVLQRSRGGTSWQSFRQASPCPDRFPRRVGVPSRRPLF
jgi:16S rRNA (guanine527-N7)-methyltransferase